jgi:hypothetical protein
MVKELEEITPPKNEDPQGILYCEVQSAIHALKRNKSPGSDGITTKMLEAEGEQLARKIHKLCNKVWNEGTIPEERRSQQLLELSNDLSYQSYRKSIPNSAAK